MSKSKIRKDKTCLNCNYVVENRFCSNCGQENIDTRKSFHHLFIHFFEDLTHYENAFWRTIKNLILRPSSLTKEYLSGKRMSYLAPVRLYIFISFVTFFLLSVIPNSSEEEEDTNGKHKTEKEINNDVNKTFTKEQEKIRELEKKGIITKQYSDSLQKYIKESKEKNKDTTDSKGFTVFGKYYKSTAELDSIQKNCKPSERLNDFEYWINRKVQLVQDKNTKEELKEKFLENFVHNLPKALFVYMPLFALVLWVFQNKKRWYYFDHGIFTLHYFSFLLLGLLIIKIENYIIGFITHYSFFNFIDVIFKTVAIVYMLYYFFPAHHRFYQEKRIVSVIKGIVMFFINMFFIALILAFFAFYTLINIH